jgi:thymidylate kinase
MRSQIRGVVLEGLLCSGKTSTLRALKMVQAEYKEGERSLIVLSEHYSQVLNNVKGSLFKHERSQHLKILDERITMLEQLNDWAVHLGDWSRGSRGLFYILERFHINHRQAFLGEDIAELLEIEKRLSSLGAKTILLTISENAVEKRLRQREGAEWNRFSSAEIEEKCRDFLDMQKLLREQSILSSVKTIEINTDNMQWDEYARYIMQTFN